MWWLWREQKGLHSLCTCLLTLIPAHHNLCGLEDGGAIQEQKDHARWHTNAQLSARLITWPSCQQPDNRRRDREKETKSLTILVAFGHSCNMAWTRKWARYCASSHEFAAATSKFHGLVILCLLNGHLPCRFHTYRQTRSAVLVRNLWTGDSNTRTRVGRNRSTQGRLILTLNDTKRLNSLKPQSWGQPCLWCHAWRQSALEDTTNPAAWWTHSTRGSLDPCGPWQQHLQRSMQEDAASDSILQAQPLKHSEAARARRPCVNQDVKMPVFESSPIN